MPARRLTLFAPGLLTPPEPLGMADAVAGLSLAAVERFLARADPPSRESFGAGLAAAREPASGLFTLFQVPFPEDGDAPVAAVTRVAEAGLRADSAAGAGVATAHVSWPGGGFDPRAWYLRADPVHLRPDLGKLLLFDAGALALSVAEARVLAGELAPLFAEVGAELEVAAPERWYLRFTTPPAIRTTPLPRVLGQHVDPYLPQGAARRRWHRLLNEVQMVLHASAVNQAREERGRSTVNSLWFWGGGRLPEGAGVALAGDAVPEPPAPGVADGPAAGAAPGAGGLGPPTAVARAPVHPTGVRQPTAPGAAPSPPPAGAGAGARQRPLHRRPAALSPPPWTAVWSGDPLARALAGLQGIPSTECPPSASDWLAAAPPPGEHLLHFTGSWNSRQYGDLEGWREHLQTVSDRWVAPLVERLGPDLSGITLITGDGGARVLTRAGRRRWWRRARPLGSG